MDNPSGASPPGDIKFGVVFQGLTRSRGFDCCPLLLRMADRLAASPLRIRCCLSTWKDEPIPDGLRSSDWICLSSEPPRGFDSSNRRRQLLSTLHGAKALRERWQPKFLIKVRTDNELAVEELAAFIRDREMAGQLADRLVFPAASEDLPFFLHDFFFAGRAAPFVHFLTTTLDVTQDVFRAMPETDFPIRYVFGAHRASVPEWSNFRFFLDPFEYPWRWKRLLHAERPVWERILSQYFLLAPKILLEGLLWRGLPLAEQAGVYKARFFDSTRDALSDFGPPLAAPRPMGWRKKTVHVLQGVLRYAIWRWRQPSDGLLARLTLLLRGKWSSSRFFPRL